MAVPVTPQTVAENLQVVKTTIPQYMRTIIDETVRERYWLANMMRYGRFSYNNTGSAMVWNFLYKQIPVTAQVRPTNIIFPDGVYSDMLTLPWRGYFTTESIHYDDLRLNGGPERILDMSGLKMNAMSSSIKAKIAGELYVNGDATGNEDRFHGMGTFQKFGGTCLVGDKIKVPDPSGTYAGKSIALAGLGGTWSADGSTFPNAALGRDWPYGSGTSEYDALSTLGVNYTSTSWTGTNTWVSTLEKVMRWTKAALIRRGAMERDSVEPKRIPGTPKDSIETVTGTPPLVNMLSGEMYQDVMNYFTGRNQQWVPLPSAVDLGFPDVINFDGMGIATDFDVPYGQGYLMSFGNMEIRSTYNDFIHAEDPVNKIEEQRILYLMRIHGNMRFRPKCFATYRAFAAS
jgi:hypothetical protein